MGVLDSVTLMYYGYEICNKLNSYLILSYFVHVVYCLFSYLYYTFC